MIPKLIEHGSQQERVQEFQIQREEFLVGRGTDCDLRLSDGSISRHHCLIRVRPQETTLVDLGSSNGTYVNGQRIVSQTRLSPGDKISMGPFIFVFEQCEGTSDDRDAMMDPAAHTLKMADMKRIKKESHLPGGASGQGNAGGVDE